MSIIPSLFVEIEKQINQGPDQSTQPDSVPDPTKAKAFTCLFRASTPEELKLFHAKCDNKGPTLTVLYGKYNVIFGGYTSKNWSSGNLVTKEDPDAFLFHRADNKTSKCVFSRVSADNKSNAILCGTDFGPTFGARGKVYYTYDLQTFTLSGMNKKTTSGDILKLNGIININITYKNEHVLIQKADINGGTLDIHQIEVYQVVDDSMSVPWREKPENIKEMKDYLINFDPFRSCGLDYLNILLLGVIGSGKSSFVNTLATVFAEQIVTPAVVMGGDRSVTNEVFEYKLKAKNGRLLRINIMDIRGYEEGRELEEELKLILRGRLKAGYKFPPKSKKLDTDDPQTFEMFDTDDPPKSKKLDTDDPPTFKMLDTDDSVEHQKMKQNVHVVCIVVDAQKFELQQQTASLMEEKEKLVNALLELDIQIVSVAVKLDERCPRISRDVDHVYKSPKAKYAVDSIARYLGLQQKMVFPVVNYLNEPKPCDEKDALALRALYEMVRLAETFIPYHLRQDSRLLEDHWSARGKIFTEMEQNYEKVRYQIENTIRETQMRFLCVGSVNSGKTSFIDSVSSALRQEICTKAGGGITQQAAENSVARTEKFRIFPLRFKNSSNELERTGIYFGDMPGFQNEGGITLHDVTRVIDGYVPDNFMMKGGINNEIAKGLTAADDKKKISAVCLLFDVSLAGDLSESVEKQYNGLIQSLLDRDIPYIVVLTKVDELSPTLRDNTCEVFKSQVVKQNKALLQSRFGFKDIKIFPVRNYVHEGEVVPEMDALLLDAFGAMLKLGLEYLEDKA